MEVLTEIAISVVIKDGRENKKISEDSNPPVSPTPVVDDSILPSQQQFLPDSKTKRDRENGETQGDLPIVCLMTDGDMFNDYIYRINIGAKLLKPSFKMTQTDPLIPDGRKNRRKADKSYQKLYNLILELHKVCFNIHYMMAQLEINEWGLTVQQFQHLFHELRDGSWDLKKLQDDTLEITEIFRKYILILDVYAKVFIDEFYNHWKNLVQLVCERKRIVLSQEISAFQNNFCGIKNKYDHFKNNGYVPQLTYDEIERFYREKKHQFFEGKHGSLSTRGITMLKEVFGDRFFRANFLNFYDCKSAFDGETDEEDNDTLNSIIHQPGLLSSNVPQARSCKKKGKLIKTKNEEASDEGTQGKSDVDVQTPEIKNDNPDTGKELDADPDKSEEEYFTGIDE